MSPSSKMRSDQLIYVPKSVLRAQAKHPKILISNLASTVTENDIRDLMETVGPVVKVQGHYSINGAVLTSAMVTFQQEKSVAKALRLYNNVKLDNVPMTFELIGVKPIEKKLNIKERLNMTKKKAKRSIKGIRETRTPSPPSAWSMPGAKSLR